ncbi:MAG: GIY-YIG nuclease family protein [bacterium]
MYYFYVLRFRNNGKLYYGSTDNLCRRIKEHKLGKSAFTSRNGLFDLIFYEAYIHKGDAHAAEKYFKIGHGREVLKDKLKNYFGGVG